MSQTPKPETPSIVRITCSDRTETFPSGTQVLTALRRFYGDTMPAFLCAMHGGVCLELNEPLREDATITGLTYRDE